MARLALTGALLTTLCGSLTARAEPPPTVSLPGGTAVIGTASPAESDDQAAARLFHEAEARYAEGDLPGALARMREAYARCGRPELLFNLGELERELGHCAAARDHYAEYVARVPDGRKRTGATRKASELRAHCPDAAPAPAPAPSAPDASPSYWTPATVTGWASIGAGVVAAAGGTYFAVHASRKEGELESRVSAGNAFTQTDKQMEQDGERSAAWARGLFAGAAVLVGAGVTLLVIRPGSSAPATTVGVGVDAQGATAVWRGSF